MDLYLTVIEPKKLMCQLSALINILQYEDSNLILQIII
jgi:hypothetical protein